MKQSEAFALKATLSVDKVYGRLGLALKGLSKAAPKYLDDANRFKGPEIHGRRKAKAA
ncbi:hypothetical protein [Shewanella baltica]|uniref:hypothetical protein n=1 Tax=Shewanella baltica TaxID=62322 RepID=UPI000DF8F301|nr:hypothetical protein [Shewanella baltica]SUI79512.1 Uncharacterised protein [Shewanella baltica]